MLSHFFLVTVLRGLGRRERAHPRLCWGRSFRHGAGFAQDSHSLAKPSASPEPTPGPLAPHTLVARLLAACLTHQPCVSPPTARAGPQCSPGLPSFPVCKLMLKKALPAAFLGPSPHLPAPSRAGFASSCVFITLDRPTMRGVLLDVGEANRKR